MNEIDRFPNPALPSEIGTNDGICEDVEIGLEISFLFLDENKMIKGYAYSPDQAVSWSFDDERVGNKMSNLKSDSLNQTIVKKCASALKRLEKLSNKDLALYITVRSSWAAGIMALLPTHILSRIKGVQVFSKAIFEEISPVLPELQLDLLQFTHFEGETELNNLYGLIAERILFYKCKSLRLAEGHQTAAGLIEVEGCPDFKHLQFDGPLGIPEYRKMDRRHYSPEMIIVEGGSFLMGSEELAAEKTYKASVHSVTLNSFQIGKYPVTQREYEAVTGKNPGAFKGRLLPVDRISWIEAVKFCNKLSEIEGFTPCYSVNGNQDTEEWGKISVNDVINCDWSADGYRLPTEAEWEYAARGGQSSRGYTFAGSNDINVVAWYDRCCGTKRQMNLVGKKKPNELGLYDMSGNVWERCWDWISHDYSKLESNPKGPDKGDWHVCRGGSWVELYKWCTVFWRDPCHISNDYSIGFRIARNCKR